MLQGVATPEADIDVSTLKHVRNDVGVMNERWVRRLRGVSPTASCSTVPRDDRRTARGSDRHVRRRLEPDHRDPGRSGHLRAVHARAGLRLLDASARHPRRARSTRRATRPGGPSSRLALDEMAASMGFVVGKLGGAPDGSRVAIELTGPLRADHQRGGARAAARWWRTSARQEPTATIELDGLLFTRLAGGRTTLAQHAAAVEYGGDRGRRQAGRRAPQLCDLSCGNTPEREENVSWSVVVAGVPLNVLPKVGGDARG